MPAAQRSRTGTHAASRRRMVYASAVLLAASATLRGAGDDVTRINGLAAKTLLGDGTDVIVGIVDGGVDSLHPALAGTDSLGRPRLVAQANFVSSETANSGDDIYGHGTAAMGAFGLRDSSLLTIGTDARYINARCTDASNSFGTDAWVMNATGFAVTNGANLINMSLGYFNANTSGNTRLALMADYITYSRRIPITVSAGNAGNATNHLPQGPGDAFNVFSVGSTANAANYGRIVSTSSYGPSTDGRSKPDLAAPGDSVLTANDDWELGTLYERWSGTSFAAPNVAGMLSGQIEAGHRWGYSVDPLVLKATMMNSAEKVQRRDSTAWSQVGSVSGGVTTITTPLDRDSGAGQVDGLALYKQYVPGDQSPTASGAVDPVGWNDQTISSEAPVEYDLGKLRSSTTLAATLTWYRKVGYTDANGSGTIDQYDSFTLLAPLSDLTLEILRDGTLFARSASTVDNVEHLYLSNIPEGHYTLRVLSASATSDEFALAWRGETLAGDLNSDGTRDATDIDVLLRSIEGPLPTARARLDLNGDYVVDHHANAADSDADYLIRTLLLTQYGDTNLDRHVDFTDLLDLAKHYGTTSPDDGWAAGNFTDDTSVNFNDLLLLAKNYGFGTSSLTQASFDADWQLAQSLVPEPATAIACAASLILTARRRRR